MSLPRRILGVRNTKITPALPNVHAQNIKKQQLGYQFFCRRADLVDLQTNSPLRVYIYKSGDDLTNDNCSRPFTKIPKKFSLKLSSGLVETINPTKVVCVHYSYLDLLLRQQKQGPMKTARIEVFKDMTKLEKLAENPNKLYSLLFESIRDAPRRHWIAPQDPTNFFAHQLAELGVPEKGLSRTRAFVIMTEPHLMNVVCKVKNSDKGIVYSVSLYDPNRTYIHQKIIFTKPEHASGLRLSDFFPSHYLNKISIPRHLDNGIAFPTCAPPNMWTLLPFGGDLQTTRNWLKASKTCIIHRWDSLNPDKKSVVVNKQEFHQWLADRQNNPMKVPLFNPV